MPPFRSSGGRRRNQPPPPKSDKGPLLLNERIRATEVRLIDEGEATIVSRAQAEALAQEKGLDLMVVSLESSPPVVKLVDYGKFRFEQEKKEREAKKNQHAAALKEVKMGVRIGEHDYQVKTDRAKEFLQEGHKVKLTIRLKGREIQHPELARNLGDKFVADLTELGSPEMGPRLEGRQLLVVMAPSSIPNKAKKQTSEQAKSKTAKPAAPAQTPASEVPSSPAPEPALSE
ncbi:MAG: translation initiation factor IF-3 [Vampirovibrionales bacterium]|nr:translation initiation factor IF-3 [Vampirovibrionales bacterium]